MSSGTTVSHLSARRLPAPSAEVCRTTSFVVSLLRDARHHLTEWCCDFDCGRYCRDADASRHQQSPSVADIHSSESSLVRKSRRAASSMRDVDSVGCDGRCGCCRSGHRCRSSLPSSSVSAATCCLPGLFSSSLDNRSGPSQRQVVSALDANARQGAGSCHNGGTRSVADHRRDRLIRRSCLPCDHECGAGHSHFCSSHSCRTVSSSSSCHASSVDHCVLSNVVDQAQQQRLLTASDGCPSPPPLPSLDAGAVSDDASTSGDSVASDSGCSSAAVSLSNPLADSAGLSRQRRRRRTSSSGSSSSNGDFDASSCRSYVSSGSSCCCSSSSSSSSSKKATLYANLLRSSDVSSGHSGRPHHCCSAYHHRCFEERLSEATEVPSHRRSHCSCCYARDVECCCDVAAENLDEAAEEIELTDDDDVGDGDEDFDNDDVDCGVLTTVNGSLDDDDRASTDLDVLTPRELRLLVKYTTGFSLRRFKCPPRDCPVCTQSFYAGSDLRVAAPAAGTLPNAIDMRMAPPQPPPPRPSGSVRPSFDARQPRSPVPQQSSSAVCDATADSTLSASGGGSTYFVDLSETGVELSVTYPDENSYWRMQAQLQQRLRAANSMPITAAPMPAARAVSETPTSATVAMPRFCRTSLPRAHSVPLLPQQLPFPMPYKNWNDVPQMCLVPPSELSSFVQTHPPARPWIPLAHPERNKPTAIFSAMCYNILCDKYCTRQLYGYSPSWALNWEYRKKGIMEEIRHYSADIISLQEVETEQFHNFFYPELEQCGYQGIFAPKSRARTMSENDKRYVDGCAIFWKRNKFQLCKEQKIEFNQIAIANAEGSEDMLNRVMTKDNIGLVAVLETKEGIYDSGVRPDVHVPKHLLVATVHVVWDPEFCDVKLIQTLMLMSELKNIIENLQLNFRPGGGSGRMDCSSMPMIFCGDLNSLPHSGVIEFLNAGKVSARHLEFKKYGYDMVLKAFSHTKDNDYLTHAFRLKQAYDETLMPCTNYTYDFKGIIDYVFYSEDHLNPLGVLGPIDPSWFKENKVVGCPHPHIASDHFSLLVEFEMPIHTAQQKGGGVGGMSAGNGPARR